MTLLVLPSDPAAGTGSPMAALGFLLWAGLVGLGVTWILLADQPRPPSWVSSWHLRWPRRVSLRRLERQILRAITRLAILDTQGVRLLPNQVQVMLAPAELRALGPLADRVAENVAHGMLTMAREDLYRLAADPTVTLVALPTHRPGRPAVRARFGRPATTLHASGRPGPPAGVEGDPTVLRRLEPPGRPFLLRSVHVRLGRPAGCDLTVPEPAVSRRHASVHRRADGWYLLDHGSTNGTFINGSRITAPAKLADGDEIGLGQRVRLRFEHSRLRAA